MSKFTFVCKDEPSPFGDEILTKRTFEFDASHLDGIIGEFETFLRGCGFQFNGHLEVVKEQHPLGKIYSKDGHQDDLDNLESIFNGKGLIRSNEC